MPDLFERYAVDLDAEVEGVWRTTKGFRIKVARINNPKAIEYYENMDPSVRDKHDNGELPEEEARQISADILAKTILMDWDESTMEIDGEKIPYSQEKAKELLSDPRLKDFAQDIWNISSDGENFRRRRLEEDVGNSEHSSDGSSNTETRGRSKPSGSSRKREERSTERTENELG